MTIEKMLKAIAKYSKNTKCVNIAKRILDGTSTIEEEIKYTGGFMTAVLNGDFEEAWYRADSLNRDALKYANI